jgi:hypothetical protein
MDKSLMLKHIKEHLKFTKDKEFADYLGIKPTVLSNWHTRNSFDNELLYTKCDFINPHWLLSGQGDMLLTQQQGLGVATASTEPTAEQQRLEDKVKYLESMLATQQKLISSYEQQLNTQDNNKQQAG